MLVSDVDALKRKYPIVDAVARYGIELRPSGRAFLGRCPFHTDAGRPNFYVYSSTQSWYCYRCNIGGDVLRFVQLIERLSFHEAVERLIEGGFQVAVPSPRSVTTPRLRPIGQVERACLAATVDLYHTRLMAEPVALVYLARRGLEQATIRKHRIGYARGDELVSYLHRRRISVSAAVRLGLLSRSREFLAGRIIVPELRRGQPIWLIGRALGKLTRLPKYLGLPGRKPLLGWEEACQSTEVYLTEGVFDWLTLRQWGFPALALCGTHATLATLDALTRFERLYLVLDNDEAGQMATDNLLQALGDRARAVTLRGVKDVADLAPLSDGRTRFTEVVHQAIRTRPPVPALPSNAGWRKGQHSRSKSVKEAILWPTA